MNTSIVVTDTGVQLNLVPESHTETIMLDAFKEATKNSSLKLHNSSPTNYYSRIGGCTEGLSSSGLIKEFFNDNAASILVQYRKPPRFLEPEEFMDEHVLNLRELYTSHTEELKTNASLDEHPVQPPPLAIKESIAQLIMSVTGNKNCSLKRAMEAAEAILTGKVKLSEED